MGEDTGFAPSTTDMMTLFNSLTSQKGGGGVYVDVPMGSIDDYIPSGARQSRPVAGGGGLAWLFYTDPSVWQTRQRISVVFLRSTDSDTTPLNVDRMPFHYVEVAIHEMVHNAPNDLSGFGKNYQHREMDAAAKKLGSTSFDQYVKDHCIPKKNW